MSSIGNSSFFISSIFYGCMYVGGWRVINYITKKIMYLIKGIFDKGLSMFIKKKYVFYCQESSNW